MLLELHYIYVGCCSHSGMKHNDDIMGRDAAYFGTDSSTLKTEGTGSSKMLVPVYHQSAQSIIT
jgi:hypothetical protein